MATPSNIPPCGGVNGLAGYYDTGYPEQDTGGFKDVSGVDGSRLSVRTGDEHLPAVLHGGEGGIVVLGVEEGGEALVVSHLRLIVCVGVWFLLFHSCGLVWVGGGLEFFAEVGHIVLEVGQAGFQQVNALTLVSEAGFLLGEVGTEGFNFLGGEVLGVSQSVLNFLLQVIDPLGGGSDGLDGLGEFLGGLGEDGEEVRLAGEGLGGGRFVVHSRVGIMFHRCGQMSSTFKLICFHTPSHTDDAWLEGGTDRNQVLLGIHYQIDVLVSLWGLVHASPEALYPVISERLVDVLLLDGLDSLGAGHSPPRAVAGGVEGVGVTVPDYDVSLGRHRGGDDTRLVETRRGSPLAVDIEHLAIDFFQPSKVVVVGDYLDWATHPSVRAETREDIVVDDLVVESGVFSAQVHQVPVVLSLLGIHREPRKFVQRLGQGIDGSRQLGEEVSHREAQGA